MAFERLLVEGNSIRSICRLMDTVIKGVLRQLVWADETALIEHRIGPAA